MNYEELDVQLSEAVAQEKIGNYSAAKELATQILEQIALIPLSEQNDKTILIRAKTYGTLGIIAWRHGALELALEYYSESLNGYILLKDKEGIAKITGNIGLAYSHKSDFENALEHYHKAMSIDEELQNVSGVARWLLNIGVVHSELSENAEALENFHKALVIGEAVGDKKITSLALGNIGTVYKELSEFGNAIQYHERALAVAEETGDRQGITIHLSNMALAFQLQSEYVRSLELFNRALFNAEEMGNKIGVATILGNIGLVYSEIPDYVLALEYLGKALTCDEEIGNKFGQSRHLTNIGIVYSNITDYQRSLEFLMKALVLKEDIGDKNGMGMLFGNIGGVYLYQSDYNKASEHFVRALAIAEEFGDKKGVAVWSGSIGEVSIKLKNREKGIRFLEQSLRLNEELGQTLETAKIKSSIGTYYADTEYDSFDAIAAEMYLLESISLSEKLEIKSYKPYETLALLYEFQGKDSDALRNFKKYIHLEKQVLSEEAKKHAQRVGYERQIGEMQREQDVTERILHNILPEKIALRIRRGDQKIVDSYESVSVLFADIVGFTKISARVTPEQLVDGLDSIFNIFDRLADKHGCEKIKTIGDCYMVVAGLPERCEDHALRLATMALDMQQAIESFPDMVEGIAVTMRIGLHSGSVVAGIIGKNKYLYDLWGDAVNTASRMESHGEAGKIHVSEDFRNAIGGEFTFTGRGEMEIKGKGTMKTYFLEKE